MPTQHSSLTEKIMKGSSIVLIFTLLGSPIGYLIRVLYSNTLSIEMFGLLYAAIAFFGLVSTYLDFGLGFSTSYFIPKFSKNNDTATVANIFHYTQIVEIAVSMLVALIIVLNASWLATGYFQTPQAVSLIHIFSLYLIANSIFTALNTFFIGLQREKYYASMQFCRLLFILIFSSIVWMSGRSSAQAFSFTWLASTALIVVVYYGIAMQKFPYILTRPRWQRDLLGKMIAYGVPTLLTTSLYTFISSTDTLFLTYFHGLKDVGIYNVVYPLATLSGLFLTPLNALILPLISHLMEGEEEKIQQLIQSILKLVPFIGLYFGLFIALFPTSIASTLFGEKWVGLIEEPLIIFSFGYILSPLSSFLVLILSGMGKTTQRLRLSVFIALLNCVLCWILIPRYGVVGAVIANTLVYIVSVLLLTRMISRFFVLNYSYGFYAKVGLLGLILWVSVKFLNLYPYGLMQIIIFGMVYTLIFIVFGLTQHVLDAHTTQFLLTRLWRRKSLS